MGAVDELGCHPDLARRVAELLKVVGQETRLRILARLLDGERCVREICPDIGEQSNISRHLAVLKAAGVITDRREANRQYYRIVLPEVMDVVETACAALTRTGP
jgi:DNA-binding transcriptional ArsR family regulator